ncbi:hypothetical protein JCM18882A_09730 [Brevibacterium metallidurans]
MQIAPPSLVRALTRRCLPQPVQVSWGERRARQARHSPRLSVWFQRRFLTRPQRKHSPGTIVLAIWSGQSPAGLMTARVGRFRLGLDCVLVPVVPVLRPRRELVAT